MNNINSPAIILRKKNDPNKIVDIKISNEDRMKYLGVLGLLSQCSVYVPDDINELIEVAFRDACADGRLQYRRLINRLEIEPRR